MPADEADDGVDAHVGVGGSGVRGVLVSALDRPTRGFAGAEPQADVPIEPEIEAPADLVQAVLQISPAEPDADAEVRQDLSVAEREPGSHRKEADEIAGRGRVALERRAAHVFQPGRETESHRRHDDGEAELRSPRSDLEVAAVPRRDAPLRRPSLRNRLRVAETRPGSESQAERRRTQRASVLHCVFRKGSAGESYDGRYWKRNPPMNTRALRPWLGYEVPAFEVCW